jgi:hypothetical protein
LCSIPLFQTCRCAVLVYLVLCSRGSPAWKKLLACNVSVLLAISLASIEEIWFARVRIGLVQRRTRAVTNSLLILPNLWWLGSTHIIP